MCHKMLLLVPGAYPSAPSTPPARAPAIPPTAAAQLHVPAAHMKLCLLAFLLECCCFYRKMAATAMPEEQGAGVADKRRRSIHSIGAAASIHTKQADCNTFQNAAPQAKLATHVTASQMLTEIITNRRATRLYPPRLWLPLPHLHNADRAS
jgi:hypothetical protein